MNSKNHTEPTSATTTSGSKPTFLGKKFNPVKASSKYHQTLPRDSFSKRIFNKVNELWKTPIGKRIVIFGAMAMASFAFVLAPTMKKVIAHGNEDELDNTTTKQEDHPNE
ncbi:hypothetical protein C9374_008628 [Naegleria lovaniensis]|uniref:Uncharacterized protein n=1 Tax=Naegleria lovaniensis TaxID=51637 RepID=A0AA88GKA0_NAELO|nr:uncharacterized protein C9374_008628 [Naegleria lovaniensis]KAG2378006.1 hypothetical protein C9374_008628 [Naegleria lovaniensis]